MCTGGCSDDDGSSEGTDVPFGETAIVTALNPVPNENNTTAVPDSPGTARGGIDVDARPGGEATTGNEGLAVRGVRSRQHILFNDVTWTKE